MWKFYHHQITLIKVLLTKLNNSLLAYHKFDFHYESFLSSCIDDIIKWAGSQNKEELLSQFLLISAEWQNATKGYDGTKMCKISTGRNDLKKLYFLKVCNQLGELLNHQLENFQFSIDEAAKDLTQLILASIQSGSLSLSTMASMSDDEIKDFWISLNGSNEVVAIKSRIATNVGLMDIQLIIKDLFLKITTNQL